MQPIELVDNPHGQDIPRIFAEMVPTMPGQWRGPSLASCLGTLLEGPEAEEYIEAFVMVLDYAIYTDENGHTWQLEQGEGAPDLWLVPR